MGKEDEQESETKKTFDEQESETKTFDNQGTWTSLNQRLGINVAEAAMRVKKIKALLDRFFNHHHGYED